LWKDVEEYGSPINYDAGKGERGLKMWAKKISIGAQKCGETIFITQTAYRVEERLLLYKASALASQEENPEEKPEENGSDVNQEEDQECSSPNWTFLRKRCVLHFDLGTGEAKPPRPVDNLLLPPIIDVLRRKHGATGVIQIWKEVKVVVDRQRKEHHYIRAYDEFDRFGSFYDYAIVAEDPDNEDSYYPAKVLLLYRCGEECNAVVWKAMKATATEFKKERSISSRWKMGFHPGNGQPLLKVVPISTKYN